ncbi:hypothetical protein RJ55_07783 [Drechmeria coniospora]|nr:hypothetical protein RJ55_07783 [Drechmeria coniospora]
MRASSLALVASTVLGLQHVAAGKILLPAGGDPTAVEMSTDARVVRHGAAADGSNAVVLDDAAEAKSLDRRDKQDPLPPDELIKWMVENNVRNDCFFVTAAHLLDTTVEDISRRAGVPLPRPGVGGISLAEMFTALETLGLRFRAYTFQGTDETTGHGTPSAMRCRPGRSAFAGPTGRRVDVMGLAYTRPDGSGHVVIIRNAGTPYARCLDFQAKPGGLDVTREVRRSNVCAYFYVDFRTSSGAYVTGRRESVEQMNQRARLDSAEPMDYEPSGDEPGPSSAGEPMEVDEPPGDGSDAVAVTEEPNSSLLPPDVVRDASSGGVDLSALSPETSNRILTDQLSQSACAAMISLGIIYTWRHQQKRWITEGQKSTIHKNNCKVLKSMVRPWSDRSARCSRMSNLEFGFALSNDRFSGTYDALQATLEGPAGSVTVPIAEGPSAGFSTWIPVDLKSAFGSDTIDIHAIKKISLSARGLFFKLLGARNDWLKVQDIALRARCATPGFDVEYHRLTGLNTWYQHPGGWFLAPFEWKSLATFDVGPKDWSMTPPCDTIRSLHYELKVANKAWAGTGDGLSFTLQGAKGRIAFTGPIKAGYSTSGLVDMMDMFGAKTVQISAVRQISLLEDFRGFVRDRWLLEGITLTAGCANLPKQAMAMKKFQTEYRWLGGDASNGTVWTGDMGPEDWMAVSETETETETKEGERRETELQEAAMKDSHGPPSADDGGKQEETEQPGHTWNCGLWCHTSHH